MGFARALREAREARGYTLDAAHHAPILIFPNPLNPQRYVVLNSGIDFRDDPVALDGIKGLGPLTEEGSGLLVMAIAGGALVVVQPPVIQLDGKSAQLSPGARIRGTNNMLLMSGSLLNQELLVNYTVEPNGLVHDVWILTEAEAAEKRKRAGE